MESEVSRLRGDVDTITRALNPPAPFGNRVMWAAIGLGVLGLTILAIGLFPQLSFANSKRITLAVAITLPLLLAYFFGKGKWTMKTGYKDLDSKPLSIMIALVAAVGLLIDFRFKQTFSFAQVMVPAATGLSVLTLAVGKPHRECMIPGGLAITAYGLSYAFLPGWARIPAGGIMLAIAGFGCACILWVQNNRQRANVGRD